MFLEKKIRNKFTVGKQLRKYKNLRQKDSTAQLIPMPVGLQQYTDQLTSKGLQINGLKFANFRTKNGLGYPGLVATQLIKANTILVKCPVELLLTTRDAYLSDIQKIFQENPHFFAKRFTSDWEDRILLSYLLYQHQKDHKSKWYNLIRNLPREIDYAIFWNEAQIANLEDKWFAQHIKQQRKKFETDCQQLIKILSKYPEFFNKQTIIESNIIWIHTHLVTRCFGKYFEYTTMVPFAQLFNHECTDVYYSMYYHPDNPHNEHQEFYDQKLLTQQEIDEQDSSDGSYEADDFYHDDQMIFFDVDNRVDWDQKLSQRQQVLKQMRSIRVHIFTFINFSDSVSLQYLILMLKQLNAAINLEDQAQMKQKYEQIHSSNVRYIKKVKQFYNKISRKYYTYVVRQKRKTHQKVEQDKVVKGESYFQKQWPKDKFDKFYMLCSTKDQFQIGSQVFFCYGRLPNKLLLMRYGFALQHNKYDHLFLKIDISDVVLGEPEVKEILSQIQINRFRRFKIKRTKMCIQLLTYFRSLNWSWGQRLQLYFSVCDYDREIDTLLQTQQFLKSYLNQYSEDLKTNEQKLFDTKLGYHQYFALVYKTEQQRILWGQIKMIEYAIEVIKLLRQKNELISILTSEQDPCKLTLQIMMEKYFKLFETKAPS